VGRVFCLGDAMVDVLARLPGPLAVGTDTPAPIAVLGGGSAANTATWLAVADVPTTFVGRVGDDGFGRAQRDALTAAGLDLAVSSDPSRPTGTCIVLVDGTGERTMIPDPGANATLCPADVPVGSFAAGGHLHVSGYALFGGPREAARHALAAARSAGVTVSVGAASSGPLRTVGAAAFLGWIGTDLLLFANHGEAAVLAGADADRPADGPTGAAELAIIFATRVGRAVVTCGADGAVYADADGTLARSTAPQVEVVDTTGAGDAFAAGVLAALSAGRSIEAALSAGHALAARARRAPARPSASGESVRRSRA
jgi:sugar/nucleoside kinase (ribokinase family)